MSSKVTYEFGPHKIVEEFVIYKTRFCYVFTNLRPSSEGHVLVSTLRRVQHLRDLTEEEKIDFSQTAIYVAHVMKKYLNTEGYSLTLQDGIAAGQTVPHIHYHVIPRNFPTNFVTQPDLPYEKQLENSNRYREFFEKERNDRQA